MIVYIPDHGGYGEVVDGGHVAQDGEHQHPGGEAGAGVDHAGDQGVPVAVVVELVVGAQSRQGTGANTMKIDKEMFTLENWIQSSPVRKEDLSRPVNPG